MVQTVRFWNAATQAYQAAAPGIRVLADDTDYGDWVAPPGAAQGEAAWVAMTYPADFQVKVDNALQYIHATPGGQTILQYLSTNNRVAIALGRDGNNVAADGAGAMNQVAQELTNGGVFGPTGRAALNALQIAAHAQSRWLANAINNSPEYTLDAAPGTGIGMLSYLERARQSVNRWSLLADPRYHRWNSSNEGFFNNQEWIGPLNAGANNIGITNHEVAAWIAGNALPGRLSLAARNHALVATLVALRDVSNPGAGCNSSIGWNPYASNALNKQRPPAIGLAHELVHAYYNARGEQPGRDFNDATTVLFEFLCMGLGPWDEALLSENGIRRHWWSHAAPLMGANEPENKKAVGKRIRYL